MQNAQNQFRGFCARLMKHAFYDFEMKWILRPKKPPNDFIHIYSWIGENSIKTSTVLEPFFVTTNETHILLVHLAFSHSFNQTHRHTHKQSENMILPFAFYIVLWQMSITP